MSTWLRLHTSGFAILVLAVTGCDKAPEYPDTIFRSGSGKGDGDGCPVYDVCSQQFETRLIPMNAPLCTAPADRPAEQQPVGTSSAVYAVNQGAACSPAPDGTHWDDCDGDGQCECLVAYPPHLGAPPVPLGTCHAGRCVPQPGQVCNIQIELPPALREHWFCGAYITHENGFFKQWDWAGCEAGKYNCDGRNHTCESDRPCATAAEIQSRPVSAEQCIRDTSCFPQSSVEGTIKITREGVTQGCARQDAPFYWFRGEDRPYLLTAQIEKEFDFLGGSWLGRGNVRLEVRRFENGRNTDPKHENPVYFKNRYEQIIYPGDVVALVPVPDGDRWAAMSEAGYRIRFLRTEVDAGQAEPTLQAAPPDFVIRELKPEVVGDTVNYTVKVCNQGGNFDLTGADVNLEIHLDLPQAPDCTSDTHLRRTLSGWFWEGEAYCRTYTIQHNDVPHGAHTAWAVIDANCRVSEIDESNNAMAVGFAVNMPQPPPSAALLKVPRFRVDVSGNTLHYAATVCNMGLTPSQPAKLRVWQNLAARPTADSGYVAHEWEIPSLTPFGTQGACTPAELLTFKQENIPRGNFVAQFLLVSEDEHETAELRFPYTVEQDPPAPAGAATTTTQPDGTTTTTQPDGTTTTTQPDGTTTTTRPDGNTTTATTTQPDGTTTTTTAEKKADLKVKEFTVSVINDLASFTVKVCNEGDADVVSRFEIGVYFDAVEPQCDAAIKPDITWEILGLAGDDCVTRSETRALTPGSFTASAVADSGCIIVEKDEQNNKESRDYAVGAGNQPPTSQKETPQPTTQTQPQPTPTTQNPYQSNDPYQSGNPYQTNPNGIWPQQPQQTDSSGCSLGGHHGGEGIGLLLLALLALARRR